MKKTEPRIMTSCHHGHAEIQNNLNQAMRVLRVHTDIAVMEIDFVQMGDDFISSHDYVAENIKNGSTLKTWIQQVVVKKKKTLWIDIKSHVDFFAFSFGCCDLRFKFDCRQLFRVLATIYKEVQQQPSTVRLQDYVWISCQDSEVRDNLIRLNNKLKGHLRWTIVTDIPFVYSYACKYLLPVSAYSWIHDYVFSYFLTYDFSSTRVGQKEPVICIDHSFFPSDAKLTQFIENSSIPLGSTLILYTYSLSEAPLVIPGYTIIMQYDYTTTPRREAWRTRRGGSGDANNMNKKHAF